MPEASCALPVSNQNIFLGSYVLQNNHVDEPIYVNLSWSAYFIIQNIIRLQPLPALSFIKKITKIWNILLFNNLIIL